MSIDLVNSVPEHLVDRASLAELLDAVKSVETWTERQAEVLDYLYRRRLVASLSRRSTLEDLRELDRHLAHVTNPIRRICLNGLGKPYWDRWQAYRDLLEARIALLRSAAPQRLAAQPRIREILERVASTPGVTQANLINKLALGKANATRILNLMEQNGLIERNKVGRENQLSLGLHGARFIPDEDRGVRAEPSREMRSSAQSRRQRSVSDTRKKMNRSVPFSGYNYAWQRRHQ